MAATSRISAVLLSCAGLRSHRWHHLSSHLRRPREASSIAMRTAFIFSASHWARRSVRRLATRLRSPLRVHTSLKVAAMTKRESRHFIPCKLATQVIHIETESPEILAHTVPCAQTRHLGHARSTFHNSTNSSHHTAMKILPIDSDCSSDPNHLITFLKFRL